MTRRMILADKATMKLQLASAVGGAYRRGLAHVGVIAVAGALSTLGCSSDESSACSGADCPATGNVEIFSWWTAPGEKEALEAVIDLYQEAHPDSTVENLALSFAAQARDELARRMRDGDPPDSFQANIGLDLLQWAETDGIEPIDDLAQAEGWGASLTPELVEGASFDGKLYAVPVNVHRLNSVFYNRKVFADANLEVPTSLDELDTACATLKSSGIDCIAVGNLNSWTLNLMTWEAVFPAVAGPAKWREFWAGRGSTDDATVSETVSFVVSLQTNGYLNSDHPTIDWTDALDRVAEGTAAMSVMGDWAKGYFEGKGLVANEDFGVFAFPGSGSTFVYTADTFPVPAGAKNRAGALALLSTFGSPEGQVAFNKIKGSVPARQDADVSQLDEMQQQVFTEWQDADRIMALSGLLDGDLLPDLSTRLKDAVAAEDGDIVIRYLSQNYAALQ